MGKNLWLGLLVCLNVGLLAAIVLVTATPRAAYAQAGPASINERYVMVTAEIQSDLDGTFVLDTDKRLLHMFYYDRRENDLILLGARDLERDLRNKE